MARTKIQQIFDYSFDDYEATHFLSFSQQKAAKSIIDCKSGRLGYNVNHCPDCGHTEVHASSCRNRNCPNCQAVLKELWIDKRKAEVINAPYYHVVFTVPSELNPLIYCNQSLLYDLMHKCCGQTLVTLSEDKKFLGATPGVIQVLHTWGQKLNYHPHIHCIISGGGLTKDKKLVVNNKKFFIPIKVMRNLFKKKFLAILCDYYTQGKLNFSSSCSYLKNSYKWKEFKDSLYKKDWCPYIKETFNGFGNAIEYLGRYTHRIAITNTRVDSVTKSTTTFSAKDYKSSETISVSLSNEEFIRRLLMHVLPKGFQKIRYYGFLNNRYRKENLRLIFKIQGFQKFKELYSDMKTAELLQAVWNYNINICPACGCFRTQHFRAIFADLD